MTKADELVNETFLNREDVKVDVGGELMVHVNYYTLHDQILNYIEHRSNINLFDIFKWSKTFEVLLNVTKSINDPDIQWLRKYISYIYYKDIRTFFTS